MNEQQSIKDTAQDSNDEPSLRNSSTDADAGPHDLDRLTTFIITHFMQIAVAAVIGAAIGLGGSWLLMKQYRAEVLMTAVSDQSKSPLRGLLGQYGSIAGLAGIDLEMDDSVTVSALAMLKSRVFIEQFISEQKLMPLLFPKLWDSENLRWRVRQGKTAPVLQEGQRIFVKKILRVVQDKDTGLITLSIEWHDPVMAAQWANELVARVNEAARTRAIASAERSIEFLGRELEHTQAVEIRQSIFSLMRSQISKRMLATTRPDFVFSVIDPAQSPELDRYVWPSPLLFGALGSLAGALLGLISAALAPHLARGLRRPRP